MQKLRVVFAYLAAAMLIFLAARSIGWYAKRAPIVQLQRQVIERVEEMDGFSYYDFQIVDAGLPSERIADIDDPDLRRFWLSPIFGVDWFHDIKYVTFAQFDGVPEDGGQAAARDEIGDKAIQPLLKLSSIDWWALSGSAVSDATIKLLAETTHPERLWLGQTQISDESLKALGGCESLKFLAIESTPTTDRGLQSLASLTKLESLSLGSPYYSAAGLRSLASMKGLKELYVDRLPIAGAIPQFATLTGLKTLSARGTGISDPELLQLGSLKNLEVLHIDSTLVGDKGLVVAKSWSRLREFTANSTLISDAGLESLEDCSELERLDIARTECTLPGVLQLLEGKQKRSLEDSLSVVFETKRADTGELISLDLTPVRIRDEDLELLQPLRQLQWLLMPNNALTNEGAKALLGFAFPKLQLLNVNGADISDDGLDSLSKLGSLRNIHVVGTDVSPEAIRKAKEAKPGLQVYRNLVRRTSNAPPAGESKQ